MKVDGVIFDGVSGTQTEAKRRWDQADTSSEPANKVSKLESDSNDKAIDPVKAASIAAAKINALYSAKKSTTDDSTGLTTSYSGAVPQAPGSNKAEFSKKIEINDLKNRYLLTRGPTQVEIAQETGAEITTRGKYYPDVKLATEKEPPLYLFISADDQASLDKAIAKVNELIETSKVPAPAPPRRYDNYDSNDTTHSDHASGDDKGHHHHSNNGYRQMPYDRPPRKFYEEDVPVNIPDGPHYNLRAKIVGPQGAYVKHISNVTGCRIQLRGKGSGFYEQETGVESEEPLHIHISTPRQDQLPKAVQLSKDLIGTIKEEVEKRNQQGAYHRGYSHPPSGSPNYHYQQGYDYQGYGTEAAGTAPTATGAAASDNYGGYDYSQYDYYGQQQYDPNYYNQYNQYYQQQPPQPTAETQPASAEPKPTSASPPSNSPPQGSPSSSYNSVPPPSHY